MAEHLISEPLLDRLPGLPAHGITQGLPRQTFGMGVLDQLLQAVIVLLAHRPLLVHHPGQLALIDLTTRRGSERLDLVSPWHGGHISSLSQRIDDLASDLGFCLSGSLTSHQMDPASLWKHPVQTPRTST